MKKKIITSALLLYCHSPSVQSHILSNKTQVTAAGTVLLLITGTLKLVWSLSGHVCFGLKWCWSSAATYKQTQLHRNIDYVKFSHRTKSYRSAQTHPPLLFTLRYLFLAFPKF